MDYQKIYNQIIDRAKQRKLEGYKEKHHIVPKCIGGSNKKENLVELTAREHFLCHWILTRIYPESSKLAYAFWFMSHQKTQHQERTYKITSRMYEEAVKGLVMTEEHKEKIRKTRAGKKTIVHPITREIKYVLVEDLQRWINRGWENTNYKKGQKVQISEQGKQSLAKARKKHQTGKTGLQSQAAKGPYTVVFESKQKYTAGSYPELVKLTGITYSTLQHRMKHKPNVFVKGWKIYKGE